MAATGGRGSRGKQTRHASGRAPGRPVRVGSNRRDAARPASPAPSAPPLPSGPFRLGAVEGATPGKWIDVWKQRLPGTPLELTVLSPTEQRTALLGSEGAPPAVDAALVRLPIDPAGLHLIPLYDEIAVVVCAADSHLTAADELRLADLAGEVVIAPHDAPLRVTVPGAVAPRFDPPADVREAIATVAAGVGTVIVPMSLARLHQRKDTAQRPLVDAPLSPVALAWAATGETPPLVDAFIGIVRGRTANSSR